MNKRLYKSETDKVIFGVCGGIAEYFETDPVIIRLLVVVFALTGGAGILFYILAAIIMREGPVTLNSRRRSADGDASFASDGAESYSDKFSDAETAGAEASSYTAPNPKNPHAGRGTGALIIGLILILIGVFYLINRYVPIFHWIDIRTVLAVMLVLAGIYFVAKR